MSDKKAVEEGKKEKTLTKYDLKMQRRQKEKEQEKREVMVTRIASVVIVLALIALIAYFPIRDYVAANEIYATIGGVDVTRTEFDFNYNVEANNYISQYGSYLSYFGLDPSADFSEQMYSETMTWQDYFQERTVNSLKETKALKAKADEAGFAYDSSKKVADFRENMEKEAKEAGVSVKKYVKRLYGPYATMSKVSDYFADAMRTNAYYKQVSDSKAASEDEIVSYYNENTANYDSVDYYMEIVDAQLPTEPTELADPADESADDSEEYKPSDAEVAKAMEDARILAEAVKNDVAKTGELRENMKKSATPYQISDWLFDDERKNGDSTVVEYTYGNQYYVVSFVRRYRDESPTANLRVAMTQSRSGQEILNEWKASAATEDSFAELCDKYSEVSGMVEEGGLLKNVAKNSLADEISDWLFAEGRTAGDTTAVTSEEGFSYVMYYIGQGDPEWKSSIASTLLNEAMEAYVDEITSQVSVEDKNDKLPYLKIRAEEEASAAAEENAE